MKRQFSYILILLMIGACARVSSHFSYMKAKNKYRSGDYFDAVISSLEALKIRSTNKKALELFDVAAREAYIVFDREIDNELRKIDPNWERVVSLYNLLISLSEELSICQIPSVRVIYLSIGIDGRDYRSELDGVISRAAEYHYVKGVELSSTDDRDALKESAYHFKSSLSYVPDFKDAEVLYKSSRQRALKSISITPFDNKVNKKKYSGISSQISDRIETMLFNDNDFIEFINLVDRSKIDEVINEQKLSESGLVDEQEIDIGKILGISEMVYGSLVRLDVSRVVPLKYTQEIEKDVIVDHNIVTDADGKEKKEPIYGTVKAKVAYHSIKKDATISVSCKVVDVETAEIIFTKTYDIEHSFKKAWAIHKSGDKRAHDFKTKVLVKLGPQTAPTDNSMVSALVDKVAKKIYKDMSLELR